MSELQRTATYLAAACFLALVSWATAPRPVTPADRQDRGAPFFPAFTDPNAATSLEVVEFDEQTSMPRPFKVMNREGKWTIPSKSDYPADARNRLSEIAAAVTALKKDDVASDSAADQEACAVLDPVDDTLPTPKGRGTRITVRGENDKLLADIIVGKPVAGRPYLRYVRVPDQTRTYVAQVDNLNISTRFEDWIERNLLQVERNQIDGVVIRNYSMDQKSGDQTVRDTIILRETPQGKWVASGVQPNEELNEFNLNLLVTTLSELTIIDVRKKPVGLTSSMARTGSGVPVARSDLQDLANKGFYLSREGELLSNEGEVLVHTKRGLVYTLRFGQVAPTPPGEPPQSGNAPTPSATPAPPVESRYMFISVAYDSSARAGGGANPEVALQLAQQRERFAPWYYVISGDSFARIRLTRSALVKKTTASPRGSAVGGLDPERVRIDDQRVAELKRSPLIPHATGEPHQVLGARVRG